MNKYKKRHNSRIIAAQVLYMHQVDPSLSWIESFQTLAQVHNFIDNESQYVIHYDFDHQFSRSLITQAIEKQHLFDEQLSQLMKNGIASIPLIERALLWIACVELNEDPPITSKSVVINETLELIKELSDESNIKFLNAILDRYASSLNTGKENS